MLNKTEILKARSRELARRDAHTEIDETIEVVEFVLGAESYGFELHHLQEVTSLFDVTSIPCAPTFLAGVINLRGLIIPIIDLLIFLNIKPDNLPVFNKAIIVEKDKLILGFLADNVIGVRKISLNELQHTQNNFGSMNSEYRRGITTDRLILLDINKLLTDPRLTPKLEKEA